MYDKYYEFSGEKLNNVNHEIIILNCDKSNIQKIENLNSNLLELMCDFTLIKKIENLPTKLEFFSCSFTEINKIENLPVSLLHFYFIDTDITIIENLPKYLKTIQYSNERIKFIDSIPIDWFNGKFTLKNYNIIKRIQRKIKKTLILKNKSARIIQNGCENWLWKPICNDGKIGINCHIAKKYINM